MNPDIPDSDYINPFRKWKTSSLKTDSLVIFKPIPITINSAIEIIFDVTKLSSNQWRRPYLLAYDELQNILNASEKDTFKESLIKVGSKLLEIEIVRFHGDVKTFFNKGSCFVKVVHTTHVEPTLILIEDEIIALNELLGSRLLGGV